MASQPRRVCFCVSSFACFAARFSFNVRLGFFGWLDGVDLLPIPPPYDGTDAHAPRPPKFHAESAHRRCAL